MSKKSLEKECGHLGAEFKSDIYRCEKKYNPDDVCLNQLDFGGYIRLCTKYKNINNDSKKG